MSSLFGSSKRRERQGKIGKGRQPIKVVSPDWYPWGPAPSSQPQCSWAFWGIAEGVNCPAWQDGLPPLSVPPFQHETNTKKAGRCWKSSSEPTGIFPMLITTQEQTLPPGSLCTLLDKVPLLSSEEDLPVPRRGREEMRLWPVVPSSPHWLCPRLWQKGIIRVSASPAREITQRRESFCFFFSPVNLLFPTMWFSFWVSSTIRSVIDLKSTSVCWKSVLQAAVINLKLIFMELTFSCWGSDCILCGCHSS